jgi:hypothetical protein
MAQLVETSETAMANRALSHIKKPAISDIDSDVSNTCQVVKKHFAPVRDALQRGYLWNFCESFSKLNASGAQPVARYRYGYDLPSDCLLVREVMGWSREDWKVMKGRRLVSHRPPPLTIRYTARTVEIPYWDPLFASAFAIHLAIALAPELASDATTISELDSKAAAILEQAYPADAAESGGDELSDTDWVTGR